jgi:hypothetical protein
MTARLTVAPAPLPLEAFADEFDPLFSSFAQRRGFRDYLMGLLLPRDRNKTLTALAGAEPITQAHQSSRPAPAVLPVGGVLAGGEHHRAPAGVALLQPSHSSA